MVTADLPTKTAIYAADELVRHVEQATGVTLQVVKESQVPAGIHSCVFVGTTEAAAETESPETVWNVKPMCSAAWATIC